MARVALNDALETMSDLNASLGTCRTRVVSGDAVDVVARLKEESDVPLRSHGSLSMNRALMAAGLVDRVQLTVFPVLDGHTQELTYRPTLHG